MFNSNLITLRSRKHIHYCDDIHTMRAYTPTHTKTLLLLNHVLHCGNLVYCLYLVEIWIPDIQEQPIQSKNAHNAKKCTEI